MAFTLFIFAGVYKAYPPYNAFPIDLTAFFLIISFISGIYILWKKGFKIGRTQKILAYLGIMFSLYVLLSLIWSPSVEYGNAKTTYVVLLNLYCLLAASFVISSEMKRVKRFFICLFIFSFWIGVEVSHWILPTSDGSEIDYATKIGGDDYLQIGRIIGFGTILAFGYSLFYARTSFKLVLSLIVIFVYWYSMFQIGGRGPLFGTFLVPLALLAMLIWSFIKGEYFKPYVKRIGSFVTVFILLIVCGIIYGFSLPELPRSLDRVSVLFQPGMGSSAGIRMGYYIQSFDIWSVNPVWGNGIGSWPLMMGLGDSRNYPHNIILEILTELGLVGFFLFGGMIAYCLYAMGGVQGILENPIKNIIVQLFLFAFLNTFFSGDLHDNRSLFFILGLMSFGSHGRMHEVEMAGMNEQYVT